MKAISYEKKKQTYHNHSLLKPRFIELIQKKILQKPETWHLRSPYFWHTGSKYDVIGFNII